MRHLSQIMRIDLQVATHFGEQIAPDIFLPVFQGGEFLAQVQAAMASFSLVGYELTGGLHPPCQFADSPFEFRALHASSIGHLCPTGQGVL
ncbi:hypothetical protein SBA4_420008 [Candidatus Sulfopaludibacter sp. SbA4]|nr:hypothetical protein SBA4_420008 [Candidatus Sulfopaludibacter sp. SbA4]